ncbi:O-antigen ligase [Ideonella sp. B508-1]|uniref:O-antigen ligase family protein n=1 Tax=Ideonella sp. B508-1 TaxID=137716 RepID=UPI00131F3465|nr:O-antigen ligase family protein [Ideonella sp. B508-1]
MTIRNDPMSWARRGIYAYLFAVPWTIVFFSCSAHDYARITEVVLGALCGLALLAGRKRCVATGRWPARMGALLFATLLLSVACSARPDWAWRELALFADLLLIAAVIGLGQRDGARQLLRVAALAFCFYGVLEVLLINTGMLQGLPAPHMDFALGYDNPRFFNHVATVAMPLCLTAALTDEARWCRSLAWVGLVFGISLTLYTGGRAVLLADTVAMLLVLVLKPSAATPWSWAALKAALSGTAVFLLQFWVLPKALGLPSWSDWADRIGDEGSVTSRWVLWRLALEGWQLSPWLGMGPMHFAHHPNVDAAHPHNIFVQMLSEWGLIAFVIACSALVVGWIAIVRRLRHPGVCSHADQLRGLGLWATLTAALVDGCFSGNFVMPVSQVWIAVAAGALWCWWRNTRHEVPLRGSQIQLSLESCLRAGTALAILLACVAAHDFASLDRVLDNASRLSISSRANPRFWSEGWF